MKALLLFGILLIGSSAMWYQVGPTKVEFYQAIGGKGIETNKGIFKTSDQNYVLYGRTDSYGVGDMNMNVIKVNAQGKVVWDKNFGAEESEEAHCGIETSDQHLMIVGYSDSYGGGVGLKDFWVIRLDDKGLLKWQQTYGSRTSIDEANAIAETQEGDFVVVGTTLDLESGLSDMLIIKIDKEGKEIWRKTYGKEKNDMANDVIRTADDGYLVVGQTESLGYGRWEVWVVALDKDGNKVWDKTYGGPDNEMGNAVAVTPDGHFVVAGYSYSFAEGSHDGWLFEINAEGKQLWSKNIGGLSTDEFFDVAITSDNHVVVAGYTDVYVPNEYHENTSPLGHNILVAKLNRKGALLWQHSFGGEQMQIAHGIVEAHDKSGYFLSGYTNENLDTRGMDMFVAKVSTAGK
ncbi:MAG: PQQ-binding-like beta-propeller repeat protein [Bernardetiaceae bacterium]